MIDTFIAAMLATGVAIVIVLLLTILEMVFMDIVIARGVARAWQRITCIEEHGYDPH